MTTTFTDCKLIAPVHEGAKTVIYRVEREQEPKSVIIKTLKAEYPTLEEITRLRHEYKILENLQLAGTVKAYGIENYHNGLALILENLEGESLQSAIASRQIPVISFLSLAIQLASALAELHKNNIIHKDIKPENLILNQKTWQIKIIDFSISTCLSRETQTISSPDLLEGTLAYMSPEQTGRMNRSIDYRTDFYSLGITFYQILTGQLPFQTNDPLELVHSHIAKTPLSPYQLNPEIPPAISDIVMKLLAKTAEERYQSALGLKADLEICLNQLLSSDKIENFTPGKLDKFGQFLIPQKLYGREAEIATLMAAFERISAGAAEMMLVSGYSGVGKTSVINEVHKPIVRQRGYFIAGKFDQFKKNIPYAALIQSFQELIRQLLTENAHKIAHWQEKILAACGQNGQVIIDVIPEVERIIGRQPQLPQLGASESQNRFNRVFQKFIQVFAQPQHPLVLFLDDLQWADLASLKLIQMLMTEADSQYLLLLGAYRDNEVTPTHAAIQIIEKIQQAGTVVNNIVLQPLDIHNVSQLVADTLNNGTVDDRVTFSKIKLLAELLFNKTQGNPFFLTQLLQTLYAEKLLTFDFNQAIWQWNIEQIQSLGITDYNVVELVARNIQKLPENTQQVLKLAACIGNRFDLDVLTIVNKKSASDTSTDLWSAIQAGLILPLTDAYKIPLVLHQQEIANQESYSQLPIAYKFLHDRVQQAAYSLIPESEKKATHLAIGELLLSHTKPEEREEKIFDIVNQLNIGLEFITHQVARDELAKLNLIAGKKAKASNAYEAAVKYLNTGLELLTFDSWKNQYNLTFDLYIEAVGSEYLNTNFERAAQLAEVVLKQAKTLLEKVIVYEAKVNFYSSQNQMQLAIDTAIAVLKMLGISLPKQPTIPTILASLVSTKLTVGKRNIQELANLPLMNDPYKRAAMRILITVIAAALVVNPELFPLVVFTMINLSIKYGNAPQSAYAYSLYGLLLSALFRDINSGYQFSELGLIIVEKFNAKELKAKVCLAFNICIKHWKEHMKVTLDPLLEGIQSGIETGDIEYACHHALSYCKCLFFTGENLELVNHKQAQYIDMMTKYKQEFNLLSVSVFRQVTLNLLGDSKNTCLLVGESFDENKNLSNTIESNNGLLLFYIHFAKTILGYLFKDYNQAVTSARLAEKKEKVVASGVVFPFHKFYYSLGLIGLYSTASKSEQREYLKQVSSNQKKMQKWADLAPCNFKHKYELVEAEKARVLGQELRAIEYYDRAIKGAKEQGYIQEEALANELAAEFYFSRSHEKIAQFYLIEAYYGYIRWGAKAKIKELELRYPQILLQMLKRENSIVDITQITNSTTGGSSGILDLFTVMKASQALSGEIILDKLLNNLMHIMMENAGASKGILFLKKAERLVIAAEASLEKDKVIVLPSVPIEERPNLPIGAINYVERTQETVVLNNATVEGLFTTDPYIVRTRPKSILCLPLIHQGKFTGILYLENNLTVGTFNQKRLSVLKLLVSQASISLENAGLYEELQTYSQQLEVKNQELDGKNAALQEFSLREQEKAQALEQSLYKLQQTQAQLVQTEKISSLGQLVAGVAHEVNNPVGFVAGNLHHASQYVADLIKHLQLYQQHFPNSPDEIAENAEEIDLEYLLEDLPKMLSSMKVGTDRIREIMQSLRNFSRVDESGKKPVNIHDGLDSTLMILQHRLKAKPERPAIQVVKEYGNLLPVECYPGQLNQVFMNLIANAIDVFDEYNSSRTYTEIERHPNIIRIRTEVLDGNQVVIRIADNGLGMTEEVRSRLFDPFFTTKPVGKGTGLGLSISYQIVVEKHLGKIECNSAPGEGTEFAIAIPISECDRQTLMRAFA